MMNKTELANNYKAIYDALLQKHEQEVAVAVWLIRSKHAAITAYTQMQIRAIMHTSNMDRPLKKRAINQVIIDMCYAFGLFNNAC